MGFSGDWVRRIMSCITSVSFSFKINGAVCGNVIPARGLRQGDPISPYLFIICAEAFSKLISLGIERKNIHGIRICRGAPVLSHLFFADDSILFAKASVQECSEVANIISLYERASGQKVNYDKTEISFSKGVHHQLRKAIVDILGVKEVDRHAKYLGLPTMIGRSKKVIFASVKDRIWKKLQGWKEKFLSRAGKEVLIKSVIQAIPVYMMSIFKLPCGLIDDLHSMFAKFWWGSNGDRRRIHWQRWELLCLPKNKGGLGFRDLKCFNDALLAKQSWRLLEGTNSLLLEVLKARYFKHSTVVEARRGYDPSFTWRSIWGAKSLLLEGLGWRIGNGTSVRVWQEKWVPKAHGLEVPVAAADFDSQMTVAELIDFDNSCWDNAVLHLLFDADTVNAILSIPLSITWPGDNLFWWLNRNGNYSVKSGYWLGLLGHNNDDNSAEASENRKFWSTIWRIPGPPKLQHFIWRTCNGSLPTKSVLFQRHCVPTAACERCNEENESIVHALVDCPCVKPMWERHSAYELLSNAPRSSCSDMLFWIKGHAQGEEILSIYTTLWAAWFYRNSRLFSNTVSDPIVMATSFNKMVAEYNEYSARVLIPHQNRVLSFQSWSPPRRNWVKINFDAYVPTGPNRGLGVVIRDHHGEVLLAAVRRSAAQWSVEVCEAAAALYALQLAVRFEYDYVHLEGDSLTVISAVDGEVEGSSPIHLLYDHILALSSSFAGFCCSFVRRNGNTVAHSMARWDPGLANEKICMPPLPQGLRTLVDLDLS